MSVDTVISSRLSNIIANPFSWNTSRSPSHCSNYVAIDCQQFVSNCPVGHYVAYLLFLGFLFSKKPLDSNYLTCRSPSIPERCPVGVLSRGCFSLLLQDWWCNWVDPEGSYLYTIIRLAKLNKCRSNWLFLFTKCSFFLGWLQIANVLYISMINCRMYLHCYTIWKPGMSP